MAHPVLIEDDALIKRIERVAEQERRSVSEVIASMVAQYRPQPLADATPDAQSLARQVRLAAYQQAREYWARVGDMERAALTDEQLDDVFWLFDGDGIPRLKSETDQVALPTSSLHRAGKALASAGFRSGQGDISARSRDILNDEFAEYLLSRLSHR